MRRRLRELHAAGALFAMVVGLSTGCGDTDRTTTAYCEQLAFVTGPEGAEVTIAPGDPNRVGTLLAELRVLLDRAPDEISTTTRTLVDFFEQYQRAPRDERRDLLAEHNERLRVAAERLNSFALDECGLFLQRAEPTPVESFDPGIEVAPE